MELCDAIIRENLRFQWSCFTRANLVDKELLQKMKDAGCYLIFFGLESGVQRLLDLIQKDLTLEQSRTAVRLCKEVGIQTWCSFILGLPSETEAESWQTIDFALELDPDYVQFPICMPWPGTELYGIAKEHGVIVNENLNNYMGWGSVVYAPHPGRDPKEVARTVKAGYKRFYLRPKHIGKRGLDLLLHHPPQKIWKLIKSGFATLI